MSAARSSKRLVCILVAGIAGGTWLRAEERAERRYDTISGFSSASIFSLTQDKDGFLWVGIEGGGLARFDGHEFRRWSPQKLTSHILFGRGAGEELALIVEPQPGAQGGNTLQRIAGEDVESITGPDGQRWTNVRDAAYDQHHRLWVARQFDLFYRNDRGAWVAVSSPWLAGDRIRRLAPNRTGGIFVVTSSGILSVDGNGVLSRLVQTPSAADVIDRGDGSIFFVEKRPLGGGIFELRDGRSTEVLFQHANFISFVLRGRSVWAAFDRGTVALRPGEDPEVLGPAQGVPGGGILVDFEGTFWVGTTSGLVKISEPETATWNAKDGLPIASVRYLAGTEEGVWVSTWGGLCRLTRVGGTWKVAAEEILDHKWPLVTDGRGRLWGQDRGDFLVRVGSRFKRFPVPSAGVLLSSARASDGTLWLGTDGGLFKTTASDTAPLSFATPADAQPTEQVFEDARGQLWLTSGNRVYHTAVSEVVSGRQPAWARSEIDGARQFSKITETSTGTLWAANWLGGVWRYRSGTWTPIPASLNLQSQTAQNLIPSRSGGVWLLSTGTMIRVIDRPQSDEGWEVVEEINAWQGLPPTNISDLIEEPDGTLWLATSAGVVRIRPDARRARPAPPLIRHTAFVVNGQPLDRGLAPTLVSDGSQVDLHFAALSYRSPALLTYQYRLRADGPWIDAKSEDAVFRFLGLRPGRYAAEVRASLDGATWSASPSRVDFEVLGPWYRRWWAIAGLFVIVAAMLSAAHRAKVAVAVRLEEQRLRIARDLHDELGSGLGSIGILAGVASGSEIDEGQRKATAATIADTAEDLSRGLSDLVWSMSSRAITLGALAARLADLGSRLLPGPSPRLETRFPSSWPSDDLPLLVRRNVTLIALEALRNAVRHAQATRVWVSLESTQTPDWILEVGDNGRGLPPEKLAPGPSLEPGHGLQNMSARASELRASLDWCGAPGGGTIVRLRFRPTAPRWPLAFLGGPSRPFA